MTAVKGGRVLVVEDNLTNQRIVRELLEQAGLRVDVSGDGQQAVERGLAYPDSCPWAAILMDVQMPVMDGYTATAEIRKEKRFGKLPIVAMTANVLPQERQRCYQAGMDDYLSKPIDPEALLSTMRRMLWKSHNPLFRLFPRSRGLTARGG